MSTLSNTIEIPLSKKKILLLLLGAIVFVGLGIWYIVIPDQVVSVQYRNPEFIRIAGIASFVFFGICAVFIAKKLFDKKIGLIIDESGITDNTNGTSIGLIEWSDITGIEVIQIMSTKILMIQTNKPYKYIDKGKNKISKRAMKANLKLYGSPISITSSSLKIKFSELETLVKNEYTKRKKPNNL